MPSTTFPSSTTNIRSSEKVPWQWQGAVVMIVVGLSSSSSDDRTRQEQQRQQRQPSKHRIDRLSQRALQTIVQHMRLEPLVCLDER
ncbi:hypothetical protein TYRP_019036 [Tyrophagus putrescentiae]|nr:hypothetical protein TYRP_019036 [Tyrophagus putrescentiae]